jgi:F0F1-type ATP synthase epsilon subunit
MADEVAATEAKPEQAATENAAPQQAADGLLHVKVWSPFKVYFDGTARSISGVNGTGTFDILPKHHNFITILNACDLQLDTKDGKDGQLKIRISGGVMHVRKDLVTVFLEV